MSDTDTAVTVMLTESQQEAFDGYRTSLNPPLSRDEMLQQIVMDWLANTAAMRPSRGEVDEGMKPADLNASNDI